MGFLIFFSPSYVRAIVFVVALYVICIFSGFYPPLEYFQRLQIAFNGNKLFVFSALVY